MVLGRIACSITFRYLTCHISRYLSEIGSYEELADVLATGLAAYYSLDEADKDSLLLAVTYNMLGIMWLHRGDFELSESYLSQGYELRTTHQPPKPGLVRQSCNNLGNAWASKNDYETALGWYTTSDDIPIDEEESMMPQAMTDMNLGRALWLSGKNEEARDRYDRSYDLLHRSSNWALLSLYGPSCLAVVCPYQ